MWAIAGVTLFYVALAALTFMRLQQRRRDKPPPFAATLAELGQDVALCGANNERRRAAPRCELRPLWAAAAAAAARGPMSARLAGWRAWRSLPRACA